MAILDFNTGIQMGMYGDSADMIGKGTTVPSYIGHYVKEGFTVDRNNHRDEVAILKWTSRTEVWISWYMWQADSDENAGRDGRAVVAFRGNDGVGNSNIYWGALDGQAGASDRTGTFYLYGVGQQPSDTTGGTAIIENIDLMPYSDTRTRVDVYVKLDNAAGVVEVFLNQASVGRFDGDTIRNDVVALENCHFGMLGDYESGLVNWNNDVVFSAAFAADESTLPITMVQHELDANGRFQEMSGSYTDINVLGDWDDSTRLESDATNQTSTFEKTNVPANFSSGYELISVGVNTRSAVGSGQPINNIAHVIDDGTNVVEGAVIAVDDLFQPRKTIFTTAPDGGAWTAAKLDATDVGVKSKS